MIVCKDPPYKVEESGYAGFILPIEVYFRNKVLKEIPFAHIHVPLVSYKRVESEPALSCSPGGAEKSALRLRPVPALGGSSPCQSPALREAHLQQPDRGVPQEAAKGRRGNVHARLACYFAPLLPNSVA